MKTFATVAIVVCVLGLIGSLSSGDAYTMFWGLAVYTFFIVFSIKVHQSIK